MFFVCLSVCLFAVFARCLGRKFFFRSFSLRFLLLLFSLVNAFFAFHSRSALLGAVWLYIFFMQYYLLAYIFFRSSAYMMFLVCFAHLQISRMSAAWVSIQWYSLSSLYVCSPSHSQCHEMSAACAGWFEDARTNAIMNLFMWKSRTRVYQMHNSLNTKCKFSKNSKPSENVCGIEYVYTLHILFPLLVTYSRNCK